MANSEAVGKKFSNIQGEFFQARSTTFNGNPLFAENKLYESFNLYNGNKGFVCGERMAGEIRNF